MRHGWRPFQKYIEVHQRILRLNHPFMENPRVYTISTPTPQYLRLECARIMLTTFSGNRVRVDLLIDAEIDDTVRNRPRARTFEYTFSANVPGGKPLIRYCSPHFHDHPERGAPHHKRHHKHDFRSGEDDITLLDAEERPFVGEFLNEVLTTL